MAIVVKEVQAAVPDATVLVVDDGSVDQTGERPATPGPRSSPTPSTSGSGAPCGWGSGWPRPTGTTSSCRWTPTANTTPGHQAAAGRLRRRARAPGGDRGALRRPGLRCRPPGAPGRHADTGPLPLAGDQDPPHRRDLGVPGPQPPRHRALRPELPGRLPLRHRRVTDHRGRCRWPHPSGPGGDAAPGWPGFPVSPRRAPPSTYCGWWCSWPCRYSAATPTPREHQRRRSYDRSPHHRPDQRAGHPQRDRRVVPPAAPAREVRRHVAGRGRRHRGVRHLPGTVQLHSPRGRREEPPRPARRAGRLFLLTVCVRFSGEIGRLEDRSRVLAEEVALLRKDLDDRTSERT